MRVCVCICMCKQRLPYFTPQFFSSCNYKLTISERAPPPPPIPPLFADPINDSVFTTSLTLLLKQELLTWFLVFAQLKGDFPPFTFQRHLNPCSNLLAAKGVASSRFSTGKWAGQKLLTASRSVLGEWTKCCKVLTSNQLSARCPAPSPPPGLQKSGQVMHQSHIGHVSVTHHTSITHQPHINHGSVTNQSCFSHASVTHQSCISYTSVVHQLHLHISHASVTHSYISHTSVMHQSHIPTSVTHQSCISHTVLHQSHSPTSVTHQSCISYTSVMHQSHSPTSVTQSYISHTVLHQSHISRASVTHQSCISHTVLHQSCIRHSSVVHQSHTRVKCQIARQSDTVQSDTVQSDTVVNWREKSRHYKQHKNCHHLETTEPPAVKDRVERAHSV